MTIDQIDRALSEWQSKMAAAGANLLELDDLLTYKRLRGENGLPPAQLTGISARRVQPALDAIRLLWKYLQLLTNVIHAAAEVRKSLRLWNADHSIRQLEFLLNGPSITLPSEETPLAKRSLLSDSHHADTTTPERLLAFMTQAFDLARTTILDVDAAWKQTEPALAEAENEIRALQAIAATLGEGEISELMEARQRVDALRSAILCDPLGVNANFQNELTPLLQRVRSRMTDLKQKRDQMQSEMRKARALLTEIETANRQSMQAFEECGRRIENTAGLRNALPDATIEDLQQWLDTLDRTLQQGRWRPARVGLDRWFQSAQLVSESVRESLAANRAPLEWKAELRGRLSSLRAKAQVFKTRGIVLDTALESLAEEAEHLLMRHPTPLNDAARAVGEYETKLNHALLP